MKTFVIAGHEYSAKNCINDILINPLLPDDFDSEPIINRTEEHMDKWCRLPYIQSQDNGIYTVRCLDGGAWDRSSLKGGFDTQEQAINFIIGKYRS